MKIKLISLHRDKLKGAEFYKLFPFLAKHSTYKVRFACKILVKGYVISKSIKKTLRLSDENWEIIQNKMKESELNFSSFALASMLNAKVKVKQTKLEREFILELAKWGNNLNQVAKHLNSKKGGVDRVALEMLSKIEEHLKKLKETIE